jgi:hypothetical protein
MTPISKTDDPRHPDREFLIREIDTDRRGEHVLLLKTLIAAAFVVALAVLRQLFFV